VAPLKQLAEHRGNQTNHDDYHVPTAPVPLQLEYYAPVAPVRGPLRSCIAYLTGPLMTGGAQR